MKNNNNSGQALLIILLAMATIATVVMSIVSRSISQVEITNREEESLRAFSAAEAGLEQALVYGNNSITDTLTVNTDGGEATIGNFDAVVERFPTSTTEYFYPFELLSGDSATVWLATKNTSVTPNTFPCDATYPCYEGNSIDICWGQTATGTAIPNNHVEAPALVLSFLYRSSATNYHTATIAVDPQTSRAAPVHDNNFAAASTTDCNVAGNTYSFQTTINFNPFTGSTSSTYINSGNRDVLAMKVKMLYNTSIAQTFAVRGLANQIIPTQGIRVTSTGQSGSATRKIEAYLINPVRPSIFDNVIYSPYSIEKN